ncbi:MAG TPA: cobalamin biosynthesis protein CbiM [Desulfuromonadales bacterium]|nr:cobalamin biosynthesis protein CbiM [Desulfuromonadales bacterium]
MHIADALISPAVGGAMWAASAAAIAYCSKKVRETADDKIVPLMGVLGAFIFAVQMINFTIPATGSSGHLGGGLMLAILLGPYAAFLTIASVLTVQALFFADGGLLALGCNIFNLGFFPAFIAYPLIYRKISSDSTSRTRITVAAVIAAAVGLQMGAFSVVLETVSSGISALSFATFLLLMQPIHAVVGVVEGVVTASVIAFVAHARPEILQRSLLPDCTQAVINQTGEVFTASQLSTYSLRGVVLTFLVAALLTGGVASWFASQQPDGLEWSLAKVTAAGDVKGKQGTVHNVLADFQGTLAFLPDYSFKKDTSVQAGATEPMNAENVSKIGTSVSGVVGGLLTLALAALAGFLLRRRPLAA